MVGSNQPEARLRFEQATPEELAVILPAVNRSRSGCMAVGAMLIVDPVNGDREPAHATVADQGTATVTSQGGGGWGPSDYMLRRGLDGWLVVFAGGMSAVGDLKGVQVVEYLLKNPPPEPLHGAELGARACGQAVVKGQRNAGLDDRETVAAKNKSRRECLAVLDDPGSSETVRKEAQAELDEIDAWAREHLRGTEGSEQCQVRAIRQVLRRLLERLEGAKDGLGRPDMVLRGFGAHLRRYVWDPSARGGQDRSLRLRAGIAGCFTYERPPGVKWQG